MDISLATSIYERAKKIKKNKFTTNAERVIEDYIAFQKNNPNLPTIAPFCKLDYHGSLFKLLSRHGENKIDTIIDALNLLLHNKIKPKDWAEEHGVKVDVVMKLLRDARVPVRTHMSKIDIIEFAKIEAMAAEEKRKHDIRNQNMKLKSFFTNTENSAETPIYTISNTQDLSKISQQELTLFLEIIQKQTKFHETEWLELKTDITETYFSQLGKTLSALSNTAFLNKVAYAYLIVGIKDSSAEICGTKLNLSSERWKFFEQKLRQSFQPSLEFEVDEFDYQGNPNQHIVIFIVHATNNGPVAYCGEEFIRIGDITKPLRKDHVLFQKFSTRIPQQQIIVNNIKNFINNLTIINPTTPQKKEEPKASLSKKIWRIISKHVIGSIVSTTLFLAALCTILLFLGITPFSRNDSNENIAAVKKDVQSTNQEYDTTKKELQATNKDTLDTTKKTRDSAIISQEKTNLKQNGEIPASIPVINEQYLITAKNIFKLANRIIPNNEKSSGLLEGLINRYNAFAKKAKIDLVKEYDSVYDRDYSMDRIAAPGIAKLNEIILNLRTYIDIAEMEMKKNRRVL